jgi:DNA replication licensing factor MCM3
MKKYIQYAKNRIKPVLTQEASDRIAKIYVGLRNDEMLANQRKTSPMTVRTLETLIRLATAHAKSRLSNRVEDRDAAAAEAILRFALFKEVLEDESRKKRRKTARPVADEEDESEDSSDDDDDDDGNYRASAGRTGTARSNRTPARGTPRRGGAANGTRPAAGSARGSPALGVDDDDIYNATPRKSGRTNGASSGGAAPSSQFSFASSMPSSQLESQSTGRGTETQDAEGEEGEEAGEEEDLASGAAALSLAAEQQISEARANVFRRAMGPLMETDLFEEDAAELDKLIEAVNSKLGRGDRFEKEEAVRALKFMDERNMIM